MGNLLRGLVGSLGDRRSSSEFYVYAPIGAAAEPFADDSRARYRFLPRLPYPVWEQLLIPWAAHRDDVKVLHSPASSGPVLIPRGIAHVVTIHDAMFMLKGGELGGKSPSLYQRVGRVYRHVVVPRLAQHAKAIITDSEFSRADICRCMNIPPDRVHVVRPAAGPEFKGIDRNVAVQIISTRQAFDEPYVLALGAIDPRKNTIRVLHAFARFRALGFPQYKLVILGLDHGAENRLRELAKDLQIERNLTLLNFVTASELVAYYNAAQFFLYPSMYEGFGLPVLEAMACGTPVITSCTTSIPEIAGSAAVLIEPTDTQGMAIAMANVAGDDAMRGRLSDLGKQQAATFSWRRTLVETLKVYQVAAQLANA